MPTLGRRMLREGDARICKEFLKADVAFGSHLPAVKPDCSGQCFTMSKGLRQLNRTSPKPSPVPKDARSACKWSNRPLIPSYRRVV